MFNKIFFILILLGWVLALWNYYKGEDNRFCTYCAYISTMISIIEQLLS